MMSTMSTSRITGSSTSTGVFGFRATAAKAPPLVDHLDRADEVVSVKNLGVNGDRLSARGEEPRDLVEGVVDHEMNVHDEIGRARKLLEQRNAHGEVRDEMAVHHVDVNVTAPASSIILISAPRFMKSAERMDGRSSQVDTWESPCTRGCNLTDSVF